jgi:hypothetical protein
MEHQEISLMIKDELYNNKNIDEHSIKFIEKYIDCTAKKNNLIT